MAFVFMMSGMAQDGTGWHPIEETGASIDHRFVDRRSINVCRPWPAAYSHSLANSSFSLLWMNFHLVHRFFACTTSSQAF